MGVLTDLVVAPLGDAPCVAGNTRRDPSWTWVDVKGLGIDDIATLHCLLDGGDPKASSSPPEWVVNPFTKEKQAVTVVGRYLRDLELVAEHQSVLVFRVPTPLLRRLAQLDAAGIIELARRWRSEKSQERDGRGRPVPLFSETETAAYVARICDMARVATSKDHELFVWMCP
jgi:hypothetical protein